MFFYVTKQTVTESIHAHVSLSPSPPPIHTHTHTQEEEEEKFMEELKYDTMILITSAEVDLIFLFCFTTGHSNIPLCKGTHFILAKMLPPLVLVLIALPEFTDGKYCFYCAIESA